MYRDLLVHVDGNEAGRHRVRYAVDLAIRMGARLNGLHVMPPVDVPPTFKPSLVDRVADEISARLARRARAAEMIFREETAQRLADACWSETAGDVVSGINAKARFADLVILGQLESQGGPISHPVPIAHAAVMECGRPVLIVPRHARPSAFDKAAIAWDGCREAVRAVHDGLPLLQLSRSVEIVTLAASTTTEDSDAEAKQLIGHLAHHGIDARSSVVSLAAVEEHEALRRQIEQDHYDLLVMGAYSHPLWLEFIFGGVTESILSSSMIPILVSH